VNLSALGIGVDFLQVISMCVFFTLQVLQHDYHNVLSLSYLPCVRPSFTSFGFAWPPALVKLFTVASLSSFNDQLLAPECSVGGWGFRLKYDIHPISTVSMPQSVQASTSDAAVLSLRPGV
jgi:hypothetical protein